MPPVLQPHARGAGSRATLLVLLGGLLAVVLVGWRAPPPDDAPRRPTDDAEVLEHVAPRPPAAFAPEDAGVTP